jgi:deoxyadenosine/deoxycytidine kinase/NTP pyrophosphatase (non-canonical NTP hydrolase)
VPERYYVAIEGPIGVGKTTLARMLHTELGADLLLEVFEENPFLSDFYADRAKYAFQTQIFFLLSRYRQQHEVIARVLQRCSLVSDYTFAKDELFARLNLSKDEMTVYTALHGVLAEKIPLPDLVVYLRADLEVLLERIAVRDRTYERAMSRGYLADLATAYDRYFAAYTQTPILTIDTNNLNIVRNPEDLASVMQRIRSALGTGTHQRPLLDIETPARERGRAIIEGRRRRLSDLQSWRRDADKDEGEQGDVYHDFLTLQAQLGGLASELGQAWAVQDRLAMQVGNRSEAQIRAIQDRSPALKGHLAGSLAGLLRLANGMGISLEEAYLARIREDCGVALDKGEA